ncbi:hypothetical protein DICVIV_07222 [Dictyocaulus viviparus]|uniref:Uncharacterized protein n=1 Tax=Dictyocaulus viviparus TaxID=29172 RepID=A0A0D8XQ01_DICVI|nr:hypothetical protein DICVIV_07222 [Dictyocaulus viviparus]
MKDRSRKEAIESTNKTNVKLSLATELLTGFVGILISYIFTTTICSKIMLKASKIHYFEDFMRFMVLSTCKQALALTGFLFTVNMRSTRKKSRKRNSRAFRQGSRSGLGLSECGREPEHTDSYATTALKMHLCERQTNFTRQACCQLILLLNDTTRLS